MSEHNPLQNPKSPQKPTPDQTAMTMTVERYSGPLPAPEVLERYDKIAPGAAERIIKMAEAQSLHRQDIESRVVRSDIRNSILGVLFGFIIALTALALSAFSIYLGHAVEGTIIGTGGLSGLASVFVYGTRSRKKEREERFKPKPLPSAE